VTAIQKPLKSLAAASLGVALVLALAALAQPAEAGGKRDGTIVITGKDITIKGHGPAAGTVGGLRSVTVGAFQQAASAQQVDPPDPPSPPQPMPYPVYGSISGTTLDAAMGALTAAPSVPDHGSVWLRVSQVPNAGSMIHAQKDQDTTIEFDSPPTEPGKR